MHLAASLSLFLTYKLTITTNLSISYGINHNFGIFHPLVVKAEYYFGTRSWWVFLIFGIICGIAPFFIRSLFWGALSAIVGFSSLWSIGEIFDQRKRVIKGWFPMNPKRKHEYPEDSLLYGGKL